MCIQFGYHFDTKLNNISTQQKLGFYFLISCSIYIILGINRDFTYPGSFNPTLPLSIGSWVYFNYKLIFFVVVWFFLFMILRISFDLSSASHKSEDYVKQMGQVVLNSYLPIIYESCASSKQGPIIVPHNLNSSTGTLPILTSRLGGWTSLVAASSGHASQVACCRRKLQPISDILSHESPLLGKALQPAILVLSRTTAEQ